MKCSRGEIYLCDLGENAGHVQGGTRPVMVISKNDKDRLPTVIVAPITTKLKKQHLPSHILLDNKHIGLKEPSLLLIEQLRIVNKTQMTEKIGIANNEILKQVNLAISKTVGAKEQKVKYLCNACVDKQVTDRKTVIRRIDFFEKKNHKCTFCDKIAYQYMIVYK